MTGFAFHHHTLRCDGLSVSEIAWAVGTPCYVYSAALVRERYHALDDAFGSYPHRLHYALKANSTLALVRVMRTEGASVDANSGGEIEVALRAGFSPSDIVFTGVGKTTAELIRAVELGVHAINAESRGELDRIGRIAVDMGRRARVALRVNPDVDASSHPHISTGRRGHKFGVPLDDAASICRAAAAHPGLQLVGLHVHIGSQLVTLDPIRRAVDAIVRLTLELGDDHIPIEHLDLGGGLGISYNGTPVPAAADYVATLLEAVRGVDVVVVLEPGRWIVGPAGVLVASVVDVKPEGRDKHFVVLDAGMSELMRPALYGAYHRIEVLDRVGPATRCDIVGPICESSDVLGVDRQVPLPAVGDLVAVFDAGAYGAAMASNYNRHAQPAEVLVDGGGWQIVRRRQTVDDMLACEE